MRIIAGELGGRRLAAPKGTATRPTSDRVRESLFSILCAPPDGTRVLDLFAGAGTLGLEALSRGAERVLFVESSKPAVAVLRKNIATLKVDARCQVFTAQLPAALSARQLAAQRFDWVFIDPPYQSPLAAQALIALANGQLLGEDPTIVIEHDRRMPPDPEVGCLVRTDRRRYGDTEISIYHRGTP